MHFLVVALGTHGDVLPLITLCGHLRSREHRVTFIAPIIYSDVIQKHDIRFVPLSSLEDYQRSIQDIALLNGRYRALFAKRHALYWNRLIYVTAKSVMADDLAVVSTDRGFLWADLHILLELKIPVIRLQFDPPRLRNVVGENAELPSGRIREILSRRLEEAWRLAMHGNGLKIARGTLTRLTRSRLREIPRVYLYPSWLTNSNASPREQQVGFLPPTSPLDNLSPLPGALLEGKLVIFLAGTLGMTNPWASRFFTVSIEVCQKLGCNGLLLGGTDPPAVPASHAEYIVWRTFFPLPLVLPHASAIVHHGGIGTIAVALGNGIPQLIVPRFVRQPSTAEWFRRLNLCSVLHEREYNPQRVSREIQALLTDTMYRARALAVSGKCDVGQVPAKVCQLLEEWCARRRLPQDSHLSDYGPDSVLPDAHCLASKAHVG
jgi:UDP:flavonoid glycosyltransferase YjiC (YdhE family)